MTRARCLGYGRTLIEWAGAVVEAARRGRSPQPRRFGAPVPETPTRAASTICFAAMTDTANLNEVVAG